MDTVYELLKFLQPGQRFDLKSLAVSNVLGLTATKEGRDAIFNLKGMIRALLKLVNDEHESIAKEIVLCLINLSGDSDKAFSIFNTAESLHPALDLIATAVNNIIDDDSAQADAWCMMLSNMTREEIVADFVVHKIYEMEGEPLPKLVNAYVNLTYNKKNCSLNYLGPMFCNLSQIGVGREMILNSDHNILDQLLPFASYEGSLIRRGGAVGILKNICFDPNLHDMIIENERILPTILGPLCGPEEFTEEENDKFPIELQYLADWKVREEDPDLRKMLLEGLLQLCATRACRIEMRAKGVYEILREYHKWESGGPKDRGCLLACENVIDILIKNEREIGLDNYRDVEVPEDMAADFYQEDAEYLDEGEPEP